MTEDKLEGVIRRVKALLETRGCTEAEAEARTAKAQELLEAYNLDMAEIGKSGKGAQRSDVKKSGGLYSWQRKLWQSVAELNFCYYVSIRGLAKGSQYEHRVIGSHANVIATEMLARYLQETVERLAQQWAKDNYYKSVFVREAIAYREGMAQRIAEKLQARRHEVVQEAKRRAADEQAKRDAARDEAAPGTTALTILDVISSEADYNNDYLNGWEPGTTARKRAESEASMKRYQADYERRMRERDEAERLNPALKEERLRREAAQLKKWAEEDARRQRRRDRTPPKPRYRKPTAEEERQGLGSYWEGRERGDKVGIDTQVDERAKRRIG